MLINTKEFDVKTGLNLITGTKYDKDGFDINGFNKDHIHKITNKKFDDEGYDYKGYDRNGFNRKGIHRVTKTKYNEKGYDKHFFNKDGIYYWFKDRKNDTSGFRADGINVETGTKYSDVGYDIDGIDKYGFDPDGIIHFDASGYNKRGFDRTGIHRITGTIYDEDGFDIYFVNKDGFKKMHSIFEKFVDETGKRIYYSPGKCDVIRHEKIWYLNMKTKTKFDESGYDYFGYDPAGYDREGYNKKGFNEEGINRYNFRKDGINIITNTPYNEDGYDIKGYDKHGFDKNGIHKTTETIYDSRGFNKAGINKDTNTLFDVRGFDIDYINKYTNTLYDLNGFNYEGKNSDGLNKEAELERSERFGMIVALINKLVSDKLSVEELKFKSKLTISDLIRIAKNAKMDNYTINKLRRLEPEYKKLNKPFDLDTFCDNYSFIINEETISLKDKKEGVLNIYNYLFENGIYRCDVTLKKYVKLFLDGNLDLSISLSDNIELNEKKKVEEERQKRLNERALKMLKKVNKNN